LWLESPGIFSDFPDRAPTVSAPPAQFKSRLRRLRDTAETGVGAGRQDYCADLASAPSIIATEFSRP
jgi:hypothetical protein